MRMKYTHIEDQGWLAWFIIATVLGRKISIFGDGKQVRDVLYVGGSLFLIQQYLRYKMKKRNEESRKVIEELGLDKTK